MSNLDLWKLYTKRLHAPRQFLDAAFYYTIGAALERRVWLGAGGGTVYPNQYILFCADAGVGKGLATGAAEHVLDSLVDPKNPTRPFITKGPDSGSYEALIHRLADSTRSTRYMNGTVVMPYMYASLRLELDELMSFFHVEANNAVKFFCSMWSGVDFDRDTLSRGHKPLSHPLLNFLAGTTPQDMKKLQRCDIMGTGFDRRIIIIYADKNEFEQFLVRDFLPEELEAGLKLCNHVERLSKVCGKLTFSSEAKILGEQTWMNLAKRNVNNHKSLQSYNANKSPQWQKYAIAMHFAEGDPEERLRTPIAASTLEQAITKLQSYELFRHFAYDQTDINELAIVARELNKWLSRDGSKTQAEIAKAYYGAVTLKQLDEVLQYLILSRGISQNGETFTAI